MVTMSRSKFYHLVFCEETEYEYFLVIVSPPTSLKNNNIPQVRRHQNYHHVRDFDRGRIVVYRRVGLSYREIERRPC